MICTSVHVCVMSKVIASMDHATLIVHWQVHVQRKCCLAILKIQKLKAYPCLSVACQLYSSPVVLQNGDEVRGSCSHVQEHGQLKVGCQLKMPLEPLLLSLFVAEL